jgi:hypothetical protein
MNVCGASSATRGRPGPIRPSAKRPEKRSFARPRSQRSWSAAMTSKPTLCGVRA